MIVDRELFHEISRARIAAHEKHGENSIESIDPSDPRWLSILVEEVGEVAHELTYDAHRVDAYSGEPLPPEEQHERARAALRAELIDLLAVASAWVGALDRGRS